MSTATLPNRRATSRLGFGSSGLHGGLSRRRSLNLLEAAFDAGIRHFDTAPTYGLGEAEEVVGAFLRRHPEATVTTKFGRPPVRGGTTLNFARTILSPIVSHLPRVKAALLRKVSAVSTATPAPASARYSVASMLASLDASRRRLGREQVDLFLLHEAAPADVDSELRDALDEQVRLGSVGAWGLGSAFQKLGAAARGFRVLQFEWSARAPHPPMKPEVFVSTHGTVRGALPWLEELVETEPVLGRWLRDRTEGPASWPRLLVGAALAANPDGLVLFSSKRKEHIRSLASTSDRDLELGAGLLELLRPHRG
jgi:hypothetical protein